jgi:hypothetical protein
MEISVSDVMKLKPCRSYNRKRIKDLWGDNKSLAPRQISELDIPYADRVWALSNILVRADRRSLVLWACDCAERELAVWAERYPTDLRPADAIRAARVCAENPTDENRNATHAAACATHAAACAANAAACAAYSAYAVDAAAYAADYAEKKWQLERLLWYFEQIDSATKIEKGETA